MATPGTNPHKKGEHVFNDIAGSLENAVAASLKTEAVRAISLSARFGDLSLKDLPRTSLALARFQNDPVFVKARTVVAPATGIQNDANSITYGQAKLALEGALSRFAASAGQLAWKKKPTSNSSFHHFNEIVKGLNAATSLKQDAVVAMGKLMDCAHDPIAEVSALSERISETERSAREAAILAMKHRMLDFKNDGGLLLGYFFEEVEQALERRVASS